MGFEDVSYTRKLSIISGVSVCDKPLTKTHSILGLITNWKLARCQHVRFTNERSLVQDCWNIRNRSKPYKQQNCNWQLANLTCTSNTFQAANSFSRSDNVVVIDIERSLVRTCKTSLLSISLAVRIHVRCSAVLFNNPTNPLIWLSIYFDEDHIEQEPP